VPYWPPLFYRGFIATCPTQSYAVGYELVK
jgi:hypothetical protein